MFRIKKSPSKDKDYCEQQSNKFLFQKKEKEEKNKNALEIKQYNNQNNLRESFHQLKFLAKHKDPCYSTGKERGKERERERDNLG